MEIVQWIMAHWLEVLGGISTVLAGLIVIFSLIPGDQPDKALQGIVDFLKKFSLK